MKLQWLPTPSSRGGWDESEYSGFDRFGTERARLLQSRDDWTWGFSDYLSTGRFAELRDAQLAAELEIKDDED